MSLPRGLTDEFKAHTKLAAEQNAFAELKLEMGLKDDGDGKRVAGVRLTAAAAASNAQSELVDEAEAEDRKRYSDMLFIQLLDAQIAELEADIDKYNEQINAAKELLAIMDRDGDIDPTDPEVMRLLKLLEIPEDEWGTVTREDIEARLDALEAAKDVAKSNLDEAKLLRDAVEINPEAVVAEFTAVNENILSIRPDAIEDEGRWFEASVSKLKLFSGTENYLPAIDGLIHELSEDTRAKLLQDVSLDKSVADRVRVDYFYDRYEKIQDFRDNPEYSNWLDKLVEEQSVDVKNALAQAEDAPEEVKQILSEGIVVADLEVIAHDMN